MRALAEAIEGYLCERRRLGYGNEGTQRWVLRRLLDAMRARLGREPLSIEVTRQDLDAVLAEGLSRGHAPITRFHTATVLGVFCRRLVKTGVLMLDPSAGLAVRRPERPLLFVPSRRQVQRLLAVARSGRSLGRGRDGGPAEGDSSVPERLRVEALRDTAALELLYGSGLRFGELVGLDVRDVDLAGRTAFIRCGKGKKDRLVPLTRPSAEALGRYLSQARPILASQRLSQAPWTGSPDRAAVFLTVSGARMSQIWRYESFGPLAREAGLPEGFTPHRLRHACALHLLESGASLLAISRLLGHASLSATTHYLRLTTASLARTLLLSHPRERATAAPR